MAENRKYRVVFIGRKFHRVFDEVALALRYSFESLGLDCDLTLEQLAPERINVLLGCHNLREVPKGYVYIPYQLEPLEQESSVYCERVRQILLHSLDIWDYSQENIAFLRGQGITAKYLPIGYHPRLETIPQTQAKDIDLFFYGVFSARRIAYFHRLQALGTLKIQLACMLFGADRDAWIARSRIILSIHQYPDSKLMGTTRLAYLMNNGCFFLSEKCVRNPYASIHLPMGTLDELIPLCEHYAAHTAEAQRLGLQWREQFKRDYPMIELLRAVL